MDESQAEYLVDRYADLHQRGARYLRLHVWGGHTFAVKCISKPDAARGQRPVFIVAINTGQTQYSYPLSL